MHSLKCRYIILLLTFFVLVFFCSNILGCKNNKYIKIGVNLELTGDKAGYGTTSLNGIKLAVKQINDAGGILDEKIQIVESDNQSNPQLALQLARSMVKEDKIIAMLGSATSSVTLGFSSFMQESRVPFVAIAATNPAVTVKNSKVNDYAFRACFIDAFQGTALANFALDKMHFTTAVVFVDESSDYSNILATAFMDKFSQNGGHILQTYTYNSQNKNLINNYILQQIKSKKPDMIFVPGFVEDVGTIIQTLRNEDVKQPVFTGDTIDTAAIFNFADQTALNNCFFVVHYYYNQNDNAIINFQTNYKKEFGIEPDSNAALGYDATMILANAIKRARSTNPVQIKKALAETKGFKGVSGTISININHDAQKNVYIMEYKNGQKIFKESIFVL